MKLKKPSKNKLTSKLLREMVAKQLQTTQPTDNQISNAFIADLISKTIKEVEEGQTEFQVGDYVRIVDGGLRGAAGKIIEPITLVNGEQGFVVLLDTDADKRVFGQAGDEIPVGASMLAPPVSAMQENEEEAAEGGEEKQQGGKDVQKAVDKLESSQMAPLFKKISNADEFEGLFKEFVNLAAQHPSIKPTAVKNILIKFAKQVASQGKQDPNKEGEQDK